LCHNSQTLKQRLRTHRKKGAFNMPVLSGKAHWASISSPNTTFEPVFTIDLSLEGDQLEQAKKLGLKVKNKNDDRGQFVTIKRKLKRKDGTDNKAPSLKDGNKRDITGTLVGNGSDVNVLFKTYEWEYAGNTGIGTDLQAVQVVNLVPYGDDDDFDVVPGGYNAEDASFDDDIPFGTSVA
jgi:hypothetical protein